MVEEETLRNFQKELWELAEKYIDPENKESVFMCGGAMLHAALQIYTVALDNETITLLIQEALRTLQPLREDLEKKIKRTLH
jgi:hypothetical protein